jgi:hypothetical protein
MACSVFSVSFVFSHCLFVRVKVAYDKYPINKAQLLSYMKLLNIPLGLIINFNESKLTDGVSRLIIPGAESRMSHRKRQSKQRFSSPFPPFPYVQKIPQSAFNMPKLFLAVPNSLLSLPRPETGIQSL